MNRVPGQAGCVGRVGRGCTVLEGLDDGYGAPVRGAGSRLSRVVGTRRRSAAGNGCDGAGRRRAGSAARVFWPGNPARWLRVVVAERLPAEDGARPVGRAAVGRAGRQFRGLADPSEIPGDAGWVLDDRDEPHAPLADGAAEGVHAKRACEELRPGAISASPLLPVDRLAGGGLLRSGHDQGSPLAPCREHTSVSDGVVARWRHARGETAQEGERIHVDRDGAVSVGPLQEDADQAVFTLLDPVLREGRPEHVSEQRLAA